MVKNLPAMQETQVQSLGREIPLEKEMATYISILAWKKSMDRGARGRRESGMTEQLTHIIWASYHLKKKKKTYLPPGNY